MLQTLLHLFQPNSFVFSYVGKVLWGLLRFSKTCEFWSSKANWRLCFLLPSIILTDLSGNKLNFNRFKRSWFLICDWRISIRFVCFCVSRFVTCDRNYDWWQPKTQLWTRLLNFGVRMFVKVVVLCWRLGKKRELRPHFHFAVLQWRQRNVPKSVITWKVVFCDLRLLVLLFSRSRCRYCRRRRRCSSLILLTKEFAL